MCHCRHWSKLHVLSHLPVPQSCTAVLHFHSHLSLTFFPYSQQLTLIFISHSNQKLSYWHSLYHTCFSFYLKCHWHATLESTQSCLKHHLSLDLTLHLYDFFISNIFSLSVHLLYLLLLLASILNVRSLWGYVLSSLSILSLGDVTYYLSFSYHEYADHSHSNFSNPINNMHPKFWYPNPLNLSILYSEVLRRFKLIFHLPYHLSFLLLEFFLWSFAITYFQKSSIFQRFKDFRTFYKKQYYIIY